MASDLTQYFYSRWGYRGGVNLVSICDQMKTYLNGKFDEINCDPEIKVDVPIDEFKDAVREVAQETADDIVDRTSDKIDEAVETVDTHIDEKFETLDEKFEEQTVDIKAEIKRAEEHLCCDICCAKKDAVKKISDKLDSYGFEEKFQDLNEQVAEILSRLPENH